MDIVLSIKKHFAIKKLNKWKKLSDIPSIRRIKDVDNGKSRVYTSEFENGLTMFISEDTLMQTESV